MLLPLGAFSVNEALQRQMKGHVEKITVVDSILVDKDSFLKRYRLQPSSGHLLDRAALDAFGIVEDEFGHPATGFTNEFGDYLVWAQPDSTGYMRLRESVRLVSGEWSDPEYLSSILNMADDADDEAESNAAFPFMLDDGVTLYYAADGDESLGGYDIFVAMKDPSDGTYLKPRNIGMPFNSPYDDYMMAIDPQTGVGWWATDRNRIEDKLTVYVYVLPEERENVDPADPDLEVYATLYGWQDVQDDDQQATAAALRKEIAAIKPANTRRPDFNLDLPGGRRYFYFSDFKNQNAASKMKGYLRMQQDLEREKKELADLRTKYFLSGKDRRLSTQIAEMERSVRNGEKKLKATLSEIIRLETSGR